MTQFARPSTWLRHLFTPAVTLSPNPGILSDDVSLNQPFDGSGWGIIAGAEYAREVTSPVGVTNSIELLEVPTNEVFRLLSLGVQRVLGADYSFSNWFVRAPGNNFDVPVTPEMTVTSSLRAPTAILSPILGPGSRLFHLASGGSAASTRDVRVYGVSAPLGTVFYV